MTSSIRPEARLIQRSCSDALWEWHVPSDALFLSRGAIQALGLEENSVPASMTSFLALLPPSCLPTLYELREGILSGAGGGVLETAYPFGRIFVREQMLVMERDACGRGTRVVGSYIANPVRAYNPPLTVDRSVPDLGYWQCRLRDKIVSLDGRSAALLGYRDGLPRAFSLAEWRQRLHPEDSGASECRYRLILDHALMGDHIEDMVRLRLENGQYASFQIRGAVMERDAAGCGTHLAGSMCLMGATAGGRNQPPLETGRLLLAIQSAGDGLWDWDAQTNEVYFSPRYLSMLGYTAEEFPGRLDVWRVKIHPDDYEKIVPVQEKLVASPIYGDTFESTYRLRRADGSWAWIMGRGYVTHRDAQGRATRLVGLHTDISAAQNDRLRLEEMVRNDPLTGLRSRAYLDMEVERIEKNHIRPVGVIMADVNGLKLINNYLGHAAGDRLLSHVAIMLRHALRATDCVARVGGDEFSILLPSCSEETLERIFNKTRECFDAYNADLDVVPVFVSMGAACAIKPSDTIAQASLEANRNMLRQKERNRNWTRERLKQWIEFRKGIAVSLEDPLYQD